MAQMCARSLQRGRGCLIETPGSRDGSRVASSKLATDNYPDIRRWAGAPYPYNSGTPPSCLRLVSRACIARIRRRFSAHAAVLRR